MIVFPDPLLWQAGLEYAVEALAAVVRAGHDVQGVFSSSGPHLEAVAFAAVQLGIRSRLRFGGDVRRARDEARVLAYPRVVAMEHPGLCRALGRGQIVITSDPSIDFVHAGLRRVPARDVASLCGAMVEALRETGERR